MAPISVSPLATIPVAVAAGYCIIGLHIRNGLFSQMNALAEADPSRLPGTSPSGDDASAKLRTSYTGVPPLDSHLTGLIRFFWPCVSGELPQASLFTFWCAGQVLAVYTLLSLDGLRAGNRGKLVSYTTIVGLLFQNIPFGIILPLWVGLYLWTSPLAGYTQSTPLATVRAGLAISDADLSVLPHSLILGYILPTVLAALPEPLNSGDQQRWFLLLWQVFPILVGVTQFILSKTAGAVAREKEGADKAASAHRLRWVYVFSLGVTALTHALTLAFIFLPGMRPSFLQPAATADLTLASVFQPPNPLVIETIPSIAHGVLSLLQYDVYFATGSVLFHAAPMYWAATDAPSLMSVLTALTGPGGAALALVWRRDEILLLADDVDKNEEKKDQ